MNILDRIQFTAAVVLLSGSAAFAQPGSTTDVSLTDKGYYGVKLDSSWRPSRTPDGAYDRVAHNSMPIAWQHLREEDILWKKRVWRVAAQQAAAQLAAQQAHNRQHSRPRGRLNLPHNRPRKRQQERAAQQAAEQAAQQAAQKAAQAAEQQRYLAAAASGSFYRSRAQIPASASRPFYPPQPQALDYPGSSPSHGSRPAASQPQYAPIYDDSRAPSGFPWGQPDFRENGQPSGLADARSPRGYSQPACPHAPLPQVSDDTLQGSRDRMTSRWFALRSIFDGVQAP